MGTPSSMSRRFERVGTWSMGTVKRELLLAPGTGLPLSSFRSGDQRFPVQSHASTGAGSSCPSHHTVLSSRSTTLVKMVFFLMASIMFGLDLLLVPGATPKQPDSGFTAQSL